MARMKVFVAGASGALGGPPLPRLRAAGHEVTGMTRREERAAAIRDTVVAALATRGAANAKAKRELRREPARRSWREGFAEAPGAD